MKSVTKGVLGRFKRRIFQVMISMKIALFLYDVIVYLHRGKMLKKNPPLATMILSVKTIE